MQTEGAQATQDELLAATTPEALADLMAKASEESPQGVTETVPETAPDSATPGAEEHEASGILTKSGKGFMPYSVLQQARQSEREAKARASDLERQLAEATSRLEALNNGGTAHQQQQAIEDLDLTDEEIEAAQADFPLLAKVARRLKAAPQAPATHSTDEEAEDEVRGAVHAAMADKPLLVEISSNPELWKRAVAIDEQLQTAPAFANKSLSERFAEVERRVAADLGREMPSRNKQPPAPKEPEIHSFRPNTTTDLMGGATPNGDDGISERASGMALASRFSTMTPAQIEAAIRRS